MVVTVEEMLAGSKLKHTIQIPSHFLDNDSEKEQGQDLIIRPLTVRDLQRIQKASREDENLSAALMIQHALVEPELKFDQVSQLPAGMAQFLVTQINTISGIDTPKNELQEMVQTPLARACFILAKEFGWTPEEVSGMTIGQILLYLEMVQEGKLEELS